MEDQNLEKQNKKDSLLPISVLASAIIIAGAWVYATGLKAPDISQRTHLPANAGEALGSSIEEMVLPSGGVVLPVRWGNLGAQMTDAGVIDKEKFESLYAGRGGLSEEEKKLLESAQNGQLKITENNAGFLLNLFWALGLGTKNDILENGPMTDPRYGSAGNFASTGGWTIAQGDAMNHYSRHSFIVLAPEQQALVERVSKNIYRPCCNNSTYFPDCNHGMAMLGLLELMASQGASEQEMYQTALRVNSYWFPDTYLTIARYLELRGIAWEKVDPKEILGADYSSASGYRQIQNQIVPLQNKTGSSCGVDTAPIKQQRSNGGCGV